MANYSLTEDQSAAILQAISIVQDMASGEPVSRPVLSETFIRNISNVQGIIEMSNSAKAERYLEKVSESLNMMGLNEEADTILLIRSTVTEVKKEVDKKHEDVDMDLELLPVEFGKFELEWITEVGIKTGLQFIDLSTKEIHHAINKGGLEIMTTIRIEELKTLIAKALSSIGGGVVRPPKEG